jgi:Spy/CpxP family protein refolding chaperone
MTAQLHIFRVVLVTVVLLSTCLLSGQTNSPQASAPSSQKAPDTTDKDIDLLRKDIRSQKKQLIAANLDLTDKEAQQFWPLYDQYTAELVKINDKKYGAIKDFAQNYDTLTDDQAESLTRQSLEVDESVAQLRIRYIPIFRKVLSGKKTALFFQLDRRLVMLIDLQLSSEIPLVEP